MVFTDIAFLFYFLPVVLALSLLLRSMGEEGWSRRLQNILLLVSSLVFYAWTEAHFVLLLLASILLDYICAAWIHARREHNAQLTRKKSHKVKSTRPILWLALAGNLSILAWFKYSPFFMEQICRLTGAGGGWEVALPLGISFYTFQSMSYTLDVYRGKVAPARSLIDFICYVTLFPQLVAGPIVRYADVAEDLARGRVTAEDFSSGARRFMTGLARKVLVADVLARPADMIFAADPTSLAPSAALLGVVCYSLQIYFDFSGYSSMAIGLGRMLGFRFVENFDRPYASGSVKEFWRRWHISLSTWFRDYLYIPLGGNRLGPLRTSLNLLLTFALCGLWHGAHEKFILWGLWHGFFLALERGAWGRFLSGLWAPLRHGYTLGVVMLGWILFRAESLSAALGHMGALVGIHGSGDLIVAEAFGTPDILCALVAGCLFSVHEPSVQAGRLLRQAMAGALTWGVFIASILMMAGRTHMPFIYFKF